MKRVGAGAVSVLTVCVLILVAAGPGAAAESPGSKQGATAYKTDPDAKPVRGTASSTDGPRLVPGTYTDTIAGGEKKYYRVALDEKSHVFMSAVLAPPPGLEVGITDGIQVALESTGGVKCSVVDGITFRSGSSRPIADYASRRIGPDRDCQEAGDYLYSVEWIGSGDGPGAGGWPVELKFMSEPGLKAGEAMPSTPTGWSSQAPTPTTQSAKGVAGGTGFNDAPAVGQGAWKDELSPGESRFYKVPVEWGQQLFLDAEFANSTNDQPSVVSEGLRMSVFNTARGAVEGDTVSYTGKPATVSLGTAPAAYANRASSEDPVSAMRFSGWYYVRVSVDQQVDSALPTTLRIVLKGKPQPGPAYDGDAIAAGFGITDAGREAAADGRVEDGGDGVPMTAIGIAGIGLGTVLVLGLGVWTLMGRRRPVA